MRQTLSQKMVSVLGYAKEEAMRSGDFSISTDHLALGLLRDADNSACEALSALGANLVEMKTSIEGKIFQPHSIAYSHAEDIVYSRSAQNTLNLAVVEASIAASDVITTPHLLLAILQSAGSATNSYLASVGITHESLKAHFRSLGLLDGSKDKIPTADRRDFNHFIRIIASDPGICS